MSRTPPRPLARAALGAVCVLVPTFAAAQIDEGTIWVTGEQGQIGRVHTTVQPNDGRRAFSEHWTVEPSLLAAGGRTFSLQPTPPRPRACPALVSFDVTFRYIAAGPTDIEDVVAAAAVPVHGGWLAGDRVEIDGDTVGWRLRRVAPNGAVDESWLLTDDYAPPRAVGLVDLDRAFARGWSRPYAERVTVVPAPAGVVAREMMAYADTLGAEDQPWLAQASYLPAPASAADVAAVCGGLRSGVR